MIIRSSVVSFFITSFLVLASAQASTLATEFDQPSQMQNGQALQNEFLQESRMAILRIEKYSHSKVIAKEHMDGMLIPVGVTAQLEDGRICQTLFVPQKKPAATITCR